MSTTRTHTQHAVTAARLAPLAMCAGLGLLVTTAWACNVGVPDPHQVGFACQSDSDCVSGYSCQTDTSTSRRLCMPTTGACGCTYPLVCKSNGSGGSTCAECKETGCGANENCVQTTAFGAVTSRCVASCSTVNAGCSANGQSGWCVVVPGFMGTTSSTVQACSTCGNTCTNCSMSTSFTSFDGATYCNTGTGTGCRTTGCGTSGTCVEHPSASPVCYTSCVGGTCGSGSVCVTVNKAFTSTGTSTTAPICIPCPSGCTACTATSPVNYASDAAPTCTGGGTGCTIAASCKDNSVCSATGVCGDGSSCNAAFACGSGQVCSATAAGTCRSASCAADVDCPPGYFCGLRRQCGYSGGGSWYPLGSSDSVSLMNASGTSAPTLQMGNDGVPVVAFINGGKLYVTRWRPASSDWAFVNRSGYDFVNQPTGTATANAQFTAALVLDGTNRPVVAWNENNTAVYLKSWSGTDWITWTGGGFDSSTGNGLAVPGGTTVGNVALSMYSGAPVVAWAQKDSTGIFRVYVRYFSGGSWVDFSGSGSGNGIGGTQPGPPSVDFHPSNNDVFVVFADGTPPASRYIRSFRSTTGGAFVELPQRNAVVGDALTPVAGHGLNGQPLMAFVNTLSAGTSLSVEQFSAGVWSSLAFTSGATGITAPSLSRDVDGNVVVAFSGVTPGGTGIHARAYTAGGWVDLHNSDGDLGLSSGSGITGTAPSVGASTRTCVAFIQGPSLFVRCHP